MKRLTTLFLSLTLLLTLSVCGGGGNGGQSTEAPDLKKYYEDFMASLGADNQPAMMDLTEDGSREAIESFFPGLSACVDGARQAVVQTAAITSVACEFVLLELASEQDAEAAGAILQSRVDSQVGGGAFYPETALAWESAFVAVKGNVAALIVVQGDQDRAVEAFNALFA